MKKIGLVPLEYRSFNYGGTLQNYALQQVIIKLGHKVELIDFDNSNEEKLFLSENNKNHTSLKAISKKRLQKILNVLFSSKINSKKVKFISFRKRYFVDVKESSLINSREIDKEFSCFVCGSDQVWNPYWSKPNHFLTFVPKDIPKVSYAASIGVDQLSNSQKETYKPLIDNFSRISVREKKGKEILQSFTDQNKEIEVVLDPTMLLSSNEWDLIVPSSEIKEKYIFTYFLGEDPSLREYANTFAKLSGYKIVNIPFLYGEFRKADTLFADIKYDSAGPEDFVNLIKNAEVILTDSFHACVFSIIYNKEFYVFDRKVYGKSMSSRITGLLDSLEIKDRIINTEENFEKLFNEKINYKKANYNLNILKENSLSFLERSINL